MWVISSNAVCSTTKPEEVEEVRWMVVSKNQRCFLVTMTDVFLQVVFL